MRPEEHRLSGPARGGGGSAGIMIGSYFRKERTVREERAGTMIGIHSLKGRIVKKKKFSMIARPLAADLPADGIFPEELFYIMKYFSELARAVP